MGTSLCAAGIIPIKGRGNRPAASKARGSELKSTVRDYGSLSYSRWKASSKILSDPGSRDLTRQLSQVPTKIVTRHWMYPLSLHCRNAISSMRLVTCPRLQISQVADSPAAIVPSPSPSPGPASLQIPLEGICELLHARARIASGAWPQVQPDRFFTWGLSSLIVVTC